MGAAPFVIDETLRGSVVVPGLIDQHLHPLLGASTLATEVIASEDWVLPRVTFPGAYSAEEYRARLRAVEASMPDSDEWLVSWGVPLVVAWLVGPSHPRCNQHHPADRGVAALVSRWFMNTAAIERLGVTAESVRGRGPAREQCDVENGHFFEAGLFNIMMPVIAPVLLSRERIERGLHQLVEYLRVNG